MSKQSRQHPTIERICLGCNELHSVVAGAIKHDKKNKFCSEECYDGRFDIVERECKFCGNTFNVEQRIDRDFCREICFPEYIFHDSEYEETLKTVAGYEVFTDGVESVSHHRLLACLDMSPHKVFSGDIHVHHVNTIPWDNRRNNVVPMYAGEHKRLHDKYDWEYLVESFNKQRISKGLKDSLLGAYLRSLTDEDTRYVDDSKILELTKKKNFSTPPNYLGSEALSEPAGD